MFCLCFKIFFFIALGQSVKEWRVWPGWDQEQLFPLHLPSSAEPGDQVSHFRHGLAGHQGYLQITHHPFPKTGFDYNSTSVDKMFKASVFKARFLERVV